MKHSTAQQSAALAARGHALVSAGAGTGKTTTVVERCLRLVLEESCSLENILMVTFTEAAAAEMRERIRAALHQRRQTAPKSSALSERLAEELALLDTALISTLHSFCLDLVRQHFHQLEIDPQFTVLDEQQTGPLIHETFEILFRRHYAGLAPGSPAVRELVRRYGAGSDASIRRLVVKIHRYTQALADPNRWFAEQMAAFANPEPIAWRNAFTTGVADWARLWGDAVGADAGESANVAACSRALAALPEPRTFEQAGHTASAIVAADAAGWIRGTKKKFRDPIAAFFTDAAFLEQLARNGGAALAEDWEWARTHILTLLQLAREFTAAFTEAKRALGGIDFADQEQLALRLLYGDEGRLTPLAQSCRARFRFVFVDECQDINAAQDAILRAVSREGSAANRFLVGDVKQSIYRFRLADPRIFQNYESRWKRPGADGQFLPLSENFRSREALLNLINSLFRGLMRPVIGGLKYEAEDELVFGNPSERIPLSLGARALRPGATPETWPQPHEVGPRVELHLIGRKRSEAGHEETDESEGAAAELLELESNEREARLVAHRLRQLKEQGHRVWHREWNRFEPVEYRDMVVLLRGLGARAEAFAKAFHQMGVPLHAERAGFLDALEITDLLNLLRLLDNPLQDVPLLAVLRSPLAGFSSEELVQVRLAGRHQLFWIALRRFHAQGKPPPKMSAHWDHEPAPGPSQEGSLEGRAVCQFPSWEGCRGGLVQGEQPGGTAALWQKTDWFLQRWTVWRQIVRQSSLSDCLETALDETHYEAWLLAGERGPARVANVRRFVNLARRFDPYQRQGLFRFLRFIEEQQEAEVRHEPAALAAENAVRLMTIHQSKGLEFSVVVLAGLGNAFNFRELHGDILLQEDFGLCPKVLPPVSRRRYPSITHWLAAQRERRALLGEEMRLLYVALTRARDTLILAGTARKKGDDAPWTDAGPISDWSLVTARSHLDWLRLWLPHATSAGDWANERAGQNDLLRWEIHDPLNSIFSAIGPAPLQPVAKETEPVTSAAELAALRARLEWRYSFAAATIEPAKTSVSTLRRRARDEADDDARQLFQVSDFQSQGARPSGAPSSQLSAAEIGTAHHLFLQFVNLNRVNSALDLRNEAERLRCASVLSPEETAVLKFEAMAEFWQSGIGKSLRGRAGQVERELPFTARFSPADLAGARLPVSPNLSAEEFVVVQGVVDLAVTLPAEIWILDYKTDSVTEDNWQEKVKAYTPQLRLYSLALARIYRRPVTQAWLHFLAIGRTVACGRTD